MLRTCNCGLRPLKDCAFGAVEDFRSEDSRSKIYPQSGADGVIVVADTVAILMDAAAGDNTCSLA